MIRVTRSQWAKAPSFSVYPTSRGTWTVTAMYESANGDMQFRHWRGITSLTKLERAQTEAFAWAYGGVTE